MPKTPNENQQDHQNANGVGSKSKSEFLQSLSEFFRRDLISIPVVKKYPHAAVQQRCGLKAATLELDTAAYPNIEYVAGTRLSVYPHNPSNHVQAILAHLVDDISTNKDAIALPPNADWWSKFVQINKADSLRLALTHLFDITIAPSRELIKLICESCCQQAHQKELKKRLLSISSSNESWERWICTGHRTLRGLFDELDVVGGTKKTRSLSAIRLLNELELQTPRQYSISNIKSSKRFRTEIIVFQHKFNLRQIELNLRQLKERETFELSASSPKSPSLRSTSRSGRSTVALMPTSPPQQAQHQQHHQQQQPATRSGNSPATRATASAHLRNVKESSSRSRVSTRSIRSLAGFASSPPISTHQVKRVPSFSGPLMSMYATAATTASQPASELSTSGPLDQAAASSRHEQMRSRMSLLSVPEPNFSDPSPVASPSSQTGAAVKTPATTAGGKSASSTSSLFEGLCSNYLLNLTTNDQIVCEFVENPRFTLKGNRERPIMMIGQDVGLIAFRPFWQQRNLEHDRAQVFYTLFKDLSPKKFGEMQLICVTGHKCKIEELLFKREINSALTSKVLSSVTYINRKHLVSILRAAHSKSQLVFAQYNSTASAPRSQHSQTSSVVAAAGAPPASNLNSANGCLQINNKELLELGDRMYRLLVEHTGCLYTCCDPHMTQAIEILLFESIARNNKELSRERVMELLPKWKGKQETSGSIDKKTKAAAGGRSASRSKSHSRRPESGPDASIFTLENTYERALIVQEIYDNTI